MRNDFILSFLYWPAILAYFGHRIGARYRGFTYGQASFFNYFDYIYLNYFKHLSVFGIAVEPRESELTYISLSERKRHLQKLKI
jgi:hypothetical protein